MTVEDKDSQQDVKEDPERLASVAHYIMMHYAEKESVKENERRNTSLRQANTAWRPD